MTRAKDQLVVVVVARQQQNGGRQGTYAISVELNMILAVGRVPRALILQYRSFTPKERENLHATL
jgi:hypothetical protein